MSNADSDLDGLANEFEAVWKSGGRPEIGSFLNRVEPSRRKDLAEMLVRLDVAERLRLGEKCDVHIDYGLLFDRSSSFLEELDRKLRLEPTEGMKSATVGATVTGNSSDIGDHVHIVSHKRVENQRIGDYRLVMPLGKGGMGEVWMADQEQPIRRRVALKLIKAGGSSREILTRFELERQALAMMDHPNIARILDAGTTDDGLPFFAMELVQGRSITEHCTKSKLSIDERLQLFIEVCNGVQHAHQKGIIHRDLKPSNILVAMVEGKAVPKIIDFGLAKALQSVNRLTDQSLYTGIGQLLGTLRYMSPEQASLNPLDVDTRTDIYSLGIILYELLTGVTPLDDDSLREHAVLNILEQIRNKEPIKPSSRLSQSGDRVTAITNERRTDRSSLNKILVGDLDWIVMKALEKERERRYESASVLALDLVRYLQDEPVLARPPSVRYRFHKFVTKNRFAVSGAAAILASLLVGIVGTSVGLVRARNAEARAQILLEESIKSQQQEAEQRKIAEERRQLAEVATKEANSARELAELRQQQTTRGIEILTGVFEDLDIGEIREGSDPLEQVLANRLVSSSQLLDEETMGASEDVAKLQNKLSMSLISLGFPKPAVELLEKVRSTQIKLYGEESDEVLGTMVNLATAQVEAGNPELASPLLEEALEVNRRKHGPQHPDTLVCLSRFVGVLMQAGEFAKAVPLLEETLTIQESLSSVDPEEVMHTMTLLGQAYSIAGRMDEATPLFEKTLSMMRSKNGEGHQSTLTAMHNLAAAYLEQNELQKATELFEQTLELSKKNLGTSHPDTIATAQSLAMAYQFQGKFAEAVEVFKRAVEQQTEKLGADHPETLINRNNLAIALSRAGQHQPALVLAQETLRLAAKKFGIEHPDTLNCMNTVASLLSKNQQSDKAKEMRVRVIAGMKAVYGDRHPLTLRSIANLAADVSALGDYKQAIKLLEETLQVREAELGSDHIDTIKNRDSLAVNYAYLGDFEKAISLLEVAVQQTQSAFGEEHPETLAVRGNLATIYSSAGKHEKSVPILEQTIKLLTQQLGAEHPQVLARASDLVSAYSELKLWDKAEPLAEQTMKLSAEILGESHPDTLNAMTTYARMLQATNRLEQAIQLLDAVVVLQSDSGPADHPDLIDSLAALATAVQQSGDEAKAINLLVQAATSLEKRKFAQRTAGGIVQALTDTYSRRGEWASAEKWHRSYAEALRLGEPSSSGLLVVELDRLGRSLIQQKKWSEAQIAFGEALELLPKEQSDDWLAHSVKSGYGSSFLEQMKYPEAEKQLLESFNEMREQRETLDDSQRAFARTTIGQLVRLYDALGKPDEVSKWKLVEAEWEREAEQE